MRNYLIDLIESSPNTDSLYTDYKNEFIYMKLPLTFTSILCNFLLALPSRGHNTQSQEKSFKANIFVVFYAKSWPNYIPIFLYTLSYQDKYFDWTIVSNLKASDLPYPGPPKNLKIVEMSYDKFLEKIRKLSPVELPPVEKIGIVDFKPFYGDVFSSYLSAEHTHWGWSDLDIFLGDLSLIGRTAGLLDIDVICTDNKICANGPLAVLRKTSFMINLYKFLDPVQLTKMLPLGGKGSVDEVLYMELLEEKLKSKQITMSTNKSLFGGYEAQHDYWFFYRGVMHCPASVECIMMHFGGGERAHELRGNVWHGMKEFFDKKLDKNPNNIILRFGNHISLYSFIYLYHNRSGVFPYNTRKGLADWKGIPEHIKSMIQNTVSASP